MSNKSTYSFMHKQLKNTKQLVKEKPDEFIEPEVLPHMGSYVSMLSDNIPMLG